MFSGPKRFGALLKELSLAAPHRIFPPLVIFPPFLVPPFPPPDELIVIDKLELVDPEILLESVALAVKVDTPVPLGVPEIVQAENDNPVGSEPVTTEHVRGAVPPLVVSAWLYADPCVPAVSAPLLVIVGAALTVIVIG